MMHIRKILIANRGEIALRIMRTCRRMGIDTVAVFSDADASAPHVHAADEAVRIGPPPAVESYLRIEAILDAARRTGADAVHPGYGFLSENAAFAEACAASGLLFIGPRPDVIRMLGSKRESKQVVAAAGVPVVPGHDGNEPDPQVLAAHAAAVGFPVLLKASAGGGGKGMRIVRQGDDVVAAIESARREARSAFGDDTLIIEKYIEQPRHVEFQILGDRHGKVMHLYERECSIQRRHQKIIEESPVLDDDLRSRMGAAAVAVGMAVGYDNAGTVEFILAPDGRFYFLEVNTRLQVEHPVTECITGLDLVREQIRIACGEPLAPGQVAITGAALECRLYAEDPQNRYLPASGRIVDWHVPVLEGVRVDAGVDSGQDVSIHYDPMLAKIISHAPTRDQAIALMIRALRELSVQGIVTNRELLLRVLSHPAFQRGQIDTHFLDRHAAELAGPGALPGADPEALWREAAIAATLVAHEERRTQRPILPALEPGFRNSHFQDQQVSYRAGSQTIEVRYRNLGERRFRCQVALGERAAQLEATTDTIALVRWHGAEVVFERGEGVRRRLRVVRERERWFVHGLAGDVVLVEEPRFPEVAEAAVAGSCTAPMPGKVVKVLTREGTVVSAGQTLLVLEAMKMEHPVNAPEAGTVIRLAVGEGEQVDAGQILAVIEPDSAAPAEVGPGS